jgi:hypothetical protein
MIYQGLPALCRASSVLTGSRGIGPGIPQTVPLNVTTMPRFIEYSRFISSSGMPMTPAYTATLLLAEGSRILYLWRSKGFCLSVLAVWL